MGVNLQVKPGPAPALQRFSRGLSGNGALQKKSISQWGTGPPITTLRLAKFGVWLQIRGYFRGLLVARGVSALLWVLLVSAVEDGTRKQQGQTQGRVGSVPGDPQAETCCFSAELSSQTFPLLGCRGWTGANAEAAHAICETRLALAHLWTE